MALLDFTTCSEIDDFDRIDIDSATQISGRISCGGTTNNGRLWKDLGAGAFGPDFVHSFYFDANGTSGYSNYGTIWAVSNDVSTGVRNWVINDSEAIGLFVSGSDLGISQKKLKFELIDYQTGVKDTYSSPTSSQAAFRDYAFKIIRTGGTNIECQVYDDQAMTILLDTLSIICSNTDFRYIVPINNYMGFCSDTLTFEMQNLDIANAEGGGSGGLHIVYLNLEKTLNNVVLDRSSTIGEVLKSDLEVRVIPDNDAPNSLAHPTIKEYLEAEENDGYRLLELNQTYIITAQN